VKGIEDAEYALHPPDPLAAAPINPLLVPQPPIAPLTPPVHVVDLMTIEGSAVFGAVRRGVEASSSNARRSPTGCLNSRALTTRLVPGWR
jgi:hypothetical protein